MLLGYSFQSMELYIHCAESKCAQLYSKFYHYVDHCVSLWSEIYLCLAFIQPMLVGFLQCNWVTLFCMNQHQCLLQSLCYEACLHCPCNPQTQPLDQRFHPQQRKHTELKSFQWWMNLQWLQQLDSQHIPNTKYLLPGDILLLYWVVVLLSLVEFQEHSYASPVREINIFLKMIYDRKKQFYLYVLQFKTNIVS